MVVAKTTRTSSSSSGVVRLFFGLSIACAVVFLWETQPQVFDAAFGSNGQEVIERQATQIAELTEKVETLMSERGKVDPSVRASIMELGKQRREDFENAKVLEQALRDFYDYAQSRFKKANENIEDLTEQISNFQSGTSVAVAPRKLKVHLWKDTTDASPREDILVGEGWAEYNGRPLGHSKDLSSPPWFEISDDPAESDLIVWVTVMARHEKEVPPNDPTKHKHKVIVLDYSDGCTIHKTLDDLRAKETELAYFKRSYVRRGEWNSYKGNCTEANRKVRPYAYCGARAMMIPMDSEGADVNYEVIRPDDGKVYGKVDLSKNDVKQPDHGYFEDPRYENFLVPFQDRKWTVTNVLRHRDTSPNKSRNRVVEWTHEFSKELTGEPRQDKAVRDAGGDTVENHDGYSAYVGEINNFCQGYCFGMNYLRHLRDAKIVVSCNPSIWEGDFRMWESFLSGAMVMVDETAGLGFMPNAPLDGVHYVTYNPADKEEFMRKLRFYTDPANKEETERIAKNGYEFVLRNHMPVNRVEHILDKVRDKLDAYIQDPSKRATLRLPAK